MPETPSFATASTVFIFSRNPSEAMTLPLRSCLYLWAFSMQASIAPIRSCWPVPIASDTPSFQNTTAFERTSQAVHQECSMAVYSSSGGRRLGVTDRLYRLLSAGFYVHVDVWHMNDTCTQISLPGLCSTTVCET